MSHTRPILLAYWLPLTFRLTHAVELTVAAFAQAYLYTQLLAVPIGAEIARHGETPNSLPRSGMRDAWASGQRE